MSIFDKFSRKNGEVTSKARLRKQRYNELMENMLSNMKRDAEKLPSSAPVIKANLQFLKHTMRRYLEENETPLGSHACFFVTEDKMTAFVLVFPPEEGGEDITLQKLQSSRHYEGIGSGVFEGREEQLVKNKEYLHFIPIARGTNPKEGSNSVVSDLYKRLQPFTLNISEQEQVNFNIAKQVQIVHKGDVICKIKPAVPGTDGMDVMGNVLPCKAVDESEIHSGRNTSVSDDGQALLADVDGVLFWNEENWTVRRTNISDETISAKSVDVAGHLYIKGDVRDGASVTATGDILIIGEVSGAQICSKNGSIRVTKGIKEKSEIKAKVQVQALVATNSKIEAGQHIYTEVIEQCDVTSGGTIHVGGEHGLILGGYVKAKEKIVCSKIGNMSGVRTQLAVGYQPEIAQEFEQVKSVLDEVQGTLEMLRKNISTMRMAGKTLSLEKRSVLEQLIEQRDAYDKRESDLLKRQKDVQEKLAKARSGSVTYKELWPVTEVQIGDRTGIFNSHEKNGNIHIYAGSVVVK